MELHLAGRHNLVNALGAAGDLFEGVAHEDVRVQVQRGVGVA